MRITSFGSLLRALALATLITTVGVLQPSAPVATAQTPADPHFEAGACPFSLERRASGREITCGHVVVTEDRRNPGDGHKTRVAVIRVKAVDRAVADANAPIVVLGGGPGQNTLDLAPWITGTSISPFGDLTTDRDWVVVDQRGAGYSQPSLTCTETDDVYIDQQFATQAAMEEALYSAFDACRARLMEVGINLAAYNSEEIATDVDDVRRALGYPRIDLFAVSYGTRVALRIMRQHPETVHAAVLDSVVPLDTDYVGDLAVNFDESFRKLAQACSADPRCSARTPDLLATLTQALERLEESPMVIGRPEAPFATITPDLFLHVLLQMLYSPETASAIPNVVTDVAERGFSYRLFSLIISGGESSSAAFSYGLYYSVNCSLESTQTGQANLPDTILPAIARHMNTLAAYQRPCAGWPNRAESVLPKGQLSIPTLIIQGSFDPVTPTSYGKRVAATLSNAYYAEIQSAGHSGTTSTACGSWLVRQFLADTSRRPSDDCARADKLTFVVFPPLPPYEDEPVDEPSIDPEEVVEE